MIVYLDKFRGFKDTIINLKKVNFFVGENSTGKTSVMQLVNLFSTPEFWFDLSFKFADGTNNSFSDLFSAGEKESNQFRIGRTTCESEDDGVVMTFRNNKGRPYLTELFHFKPNHIIVCKESGENQWLVFGQKRDVKDFKQFIESIDEFKPHIDDNITPSSFPVDNSQMANILLMVVRSIRRSSENNDEIGNLRQSIDVSQMAEGLSMWGRHKHIMPIRPKPSKYYLDADLNEDEKYPSFIKEAYEKRGKIIDIINEYGKRSGLFDNLVPKYFGESQESPFSLVLELDGRAVSYTNVGYGVSQSLPIVCEFTSAADVISIQQPEVHLHPKAQSAMGEFLYKMSKKRKSTFLIETHSDFVIDRFRRNIRDNGFDHAAQVLFFNRNNSHNEVSIISIDEEGRYDEDQCQEFREFFLNEQLDNLGI